MTNAEYFKIKEDLADQLGIVLADCNCDKTKINDGLWSKLCQIYRQIEDYI